MNNFPVMGNIPLFAQIERMPETHKKSLEDYDQIHQKPWDHLHDGSIEILAAISKGNKTLDIACGDGFVEQLSPETVGLDFSINALLKAKKNGARHLVQATAENLPFKDNAFDLTICAGSLEHFINPEKAIAEMARVSKLQLLTVHASVPGHSLISRLLQVKHQPIERPISMKRLEKILNRSGLRTVFKGVWTLPLNYGRVIKWLPQFTSFPSTNFVISIKK